MTVFQAIILGIVQGSTEFIPISSSAHLIIIPWIFKWPDPGLAFDVALHLGTLVALIWYFWRDWIRLVRAFIASIIERKIGGETDRRIAWFIIVGTIPGGIAGYFGESRIEELFHKGSSPHAAGAMISMAIIIALLGAALFAAERVARHSKGFDLMSLRDSIIIGLGQALAIFPGVSRSGSTITVGLALGLKRETAARFSFLLSAPIILGAGLKSLLDVHEELASGAMAQSDLRFFAVGFIAAAVFGYLSIRFLLKFLRTHSIDIFVYYRWLLSVLIIILVFFKVN